MTELNITYEGGCGCGFVRYKVVSEPLITHCCHCRLCQRQTGSAFALNALYDSNNVNVLAGTVEQIITPSPSGKGQNIARCPKCRIALWSSYFIGGIREKIRFVRVGTLDNPDAFPPNVHIFTTTKQPWINLSAEAAVFEAFYDYEQTWTHENNNHRKSLLAKSVDE
jgi:hypothetical protein